MVMDCFKVSVCKFRIFFPVRCIDKLSFVIFVQNKIKSDINA